MNKLFSGAIMCKKYDRDIISTHIRAICVIAENHDEATGMILREGEKLYPEKEGYSNYTVSVVDVTHLIEKL